MTFRLLVADDCPRLITLLRTCFRGLAGDVEPSADAAAAVRLADSDAPFDAAIGDLRFTGDRLGEGFEIVERARHRRPRAAVLLFTGVPADGERAEARRRGAHEVITKPAPSPACAKPRSVP